MPSLKMVVSVASLTIGSGCCVADAVDFDGAVTVVVWTCWKVAVVTGFVAVVTGFVADVAVVTVTGSVTVGSDVAEVVLLGWLEHASLHFRVTEGTSITGAASPQRRRLCLVSWLDIVTEGEGGGSGCRQWSPICLLRDIDGIGAHNLSD